MRFIKAVILVFVLTIPCCTFAQTRILNQAPTFVFSSPITDSFSGTVLNVGDIIEFDVSPNTNNPTSITPSLTGTCVATGGAVVDKGPSNQGTAIASSELGHFVLTAGGSNCGLSIAYGAGTGGTTDATLSDFICRSCALDVIAADFNPQNAANGTNAILSDSVTTSTKDLCWVATVDDNESGGVLSAGTNITWTNFVVNTTFPNGNETFTQSAAGAIQGAFTDAVNMYTQTAIVCFKPTSGLTCVPSLMLTHAGGPC